jgi:hypothetical protein
MPSPSLRSLIGDDLDYLLALAREDQKRHEDAINEHHRTTLTIRGFAITAVAALIAAVFVSRSVIPAIIATLLSAFFCFVDYYYSRLYGQVSQRLPVLEQLNKRHRGLLARPHPIPQRSLHHLRSALRTYSGGPSIPRTPRLRPVRPLGKPFTIFLLLYIGLASSAIAGGVYSLNHREDGTTNVVIRCFSAGQLDSVSECSRAGRSAADDPRPDSVGKRPHSMAPDSRADPSGPP